MLYNTNKKYYCIYEICLSNTSILVCVDVMDGLEK